jgi:ComF family protein
MKKRGHVGRRLVRLAHSFCRIVVDFVYPPLCLICHKHLEPEIRFVCPSCWDAFEVLQQPLVPLAQLDILHGKAAYFDHSLAIYSYSEAIQHLIHTMKYKNMPGICALFGDALGSLAREQGFLQDIDLILPVPLHPIRYRERGFNQAAILAQHIGRLNNVFVDDKVLKRIRYTDQQAKFSKQERAKNVKDAFRVSSESAVAHKQIALVDDVLTTGSTMNECAKVLKTRGAGRITAISIVRI